ncbi:type III-A CRISPR-associated RAMP protein Csm3 [Deinococcus sp. Arct2-2]|uniref:type III-A CRISPR-associated RAMP protein Csm3 n=1 Tax=Deinococcus sp. Arct2-2 TaxID=2568653 RepID=UPI0010A2E8F2|nr:type III-A CRISPR-associated RAMP protein Csm3 [Deinococcus sp. Arct2-2]THF70978.1 type III-A CRISPR-associated RAMP protein Csm3 [Deinococcus sp. Arct2-2]
MERQFHGKIIIELPFKLMTGTHIGNANDGFAIGGIDKVVVRDAVTRLPIVPGSSLKGKLRSIVEAMEGMDKKQPMEQGKWYNRGHSDMYRHEADTREEALKHAVDRTFGTTGKGSRDSNHPARLAVSDAQVTAGTAEVLSDLEGDFPFTEIKSENFLDRITSAANPRSLERVPAGSVFVSRLTYTVEDLSQVEADLKYVLAALLWLEDDYIGGNGSRGYGRVRFGKAPQLPLDTISSLPIRVTVKSRSSYLSDAPVPAQEFDSIQTLRQALSGTLLQALRG